MSTRTDPVDRMDAPPKVVEAVAAGIGSKAPARWPGQQHTLRGPVRIDGVGLHTGVGVRLELRPEVPGRGIRFVRGDVAGARPIPADVAHVIETRFATSIGTSGDCGGPRDDAVSEDWAGAPGSIGAAQEGREPRHGAEFEGSDRAAARSMDGPGWRIDTVEHLLAALSGCGVDNALVVVDGPELPILDGSAAGFVEAIDRAGLEPQPPPRRFLRVLRPITVGTAERGARLLPADRFTLACTIGFDHPRLRHQALELDFGDFRTGLATARTFGLLRDVDAMRAAGLIRGGGLENALVLGDDGWVNPEGPRFADEPARHKLLDAVGDLALAGGRLLARYEGMRAGHALNVALVRAVLEHPGAAEWVDAR